jgi:hypothetical protein
VQPAALRSELAGRSPERDRCGPAGPALIHHLGLTGLRAGDRTISSRRSRSTGSTRNTRSLTCPPISICRPAPASGSCPTTPVPRRTCTGRCSCSTGERSPASGPSNHPAGAERRSPPALPLPAASRARRRCGAGAGRLAAPRGSLWASTGPHQCHQRDRCGGRTQGTHDVPPNREFPGPGRKPSIRAFTYETLRSNSATLRSKSQATGPRYTRGCSSWRTRLVAATRPSMPSLS